MIYTLETAKKDHQAIKLINKAFHDIDSDFYDIKHAESADVARENCIELFKSFIKAPAMAVDFTLLDVGTGTGFFISNIVDFLRPENTVIFNDISEKMIEMVKNKFSNRHFKKIFIVADAENYDLPSASIDVIIIHSVLHHLPNYCAFLKEADRLLKPGGLLIITHEPNRSFNRNIIITTVIKVYSKFNDYINVVKSQQVKHVNDTLYQRLVEDLKGQGLEFCESLTINQLNSLIDIESPTAAGTYDAAKGFDPSVILASFHGYQVLRNRTYAFLGKIDERKNFLTRFCAVVLRRFFPDDGYHFELIIKK